jgi:hypothetical protein
MNITTQRLRLCGAARLVLVASLLIGFAPALGASAPRAGPDAQGRAASLEGRVIDLETKRPVAGAKVDVQRSLPSSELRRAAPEDASIGSSTDHEGRFRLTFPSEEANPHGATITLRVTCAGYVGRESMRLDLASLIAGEDGAAATPLETVTLARGPEHTGRIVAPSGKPLAGLECRFINWTQPTNPSGQFHDLLSAKTDADGRFRLRMTRSHQLALYLAPEEHALFQRFWGVDDVNLQPDVWVPADLGEVMLDAGIRVSGRLIDRRGHPLPGQTITVRALYGNLASNQARLATTDADGRFTFRPLRPGNYLLHGHGQTFDSNLSDEEATAGQSGVFIAPLKLYLGEGVAPRPLLLRAGDSVTIECRCTDSSDRPVRSSRIFAGGMVAQPQRRPRPNQGVVGAGLSALINGPELEDRSPPPTRWSALVVPDEAGNAVFQAPRGLSSAGIWANAGGREVSIKTRSGPGQPLLLGPNVPLGDLADNVHGVSFVYYKSPRIRVAVQNEAGDPPLVNVQVQARYAAAGNFVWNQFSEQNDGRFRSQGLFPDEEYWVAAWATGLLPFAPRRIKLREGEEIELVVLLRTMPGPPKIGDLAPPFWVRTLDGPIISLAELRGKFVLIHFWQPFDANGLPAIASIKKLREQFGSDKRLMVLGFCFHPSPIEARRGIAQKGANWPQILLTDLWADPIAMEYQAWNMAKAYLIGPDGKIAATIAQGEQIEDVVAAALRGK